MKDIPKISDAERQVMKVLWENSPLTSTQIIDELKDDTTWNSKTIHTLISRLVKKEAVEAKKDGNYYLYYPMITEEECKKDETKTFLQKVYNGSLKMLVSNFIKEGEISNEEIDELQQILDQSKNQK